VPARAMGSHHLEMTDHGATSNSDDWRSSVN
jgi:hypothetical protein